MPPPPVPFYEIRIEPHTRDLLAELYLLLSAHRSPAAAGLASGAAPARASLRGANTCLRLPSKALLTECGNPSASLPRAAADAPHAHGGRRAASGRAAAAGAACRRSPNELRAVLAHELAHLRRRDTLVNLLLRTLAANRVSPGDFALIQHRIQHARELLCDAVAARALPSSREAYAQVLLTLAQQLLPSGGHCFTQHRRAPCTHVQTTVGGSHHEADHPAHAACAPPLACCASPPEPRSLVPPPSHRHLSSTLTPICAGRAAGEPYGPDSLACSMLRGQGSPAAASALPLQPSSPARSSDAAGPAGRRRQTDTPGEASRVARSAGAAGPQASRRCRG